MNLLRLSLFRTPTSGRRMPHVPTPEYRLRMYRRAAAERAPVHFANAAPWRWLNRERT